MVRRTGWTPLAARILVWFWLVLLVLSAGGFAALQWLGPRRVETATAPMATAPPAAPTKPAAAAPAAPRAAVQPASSEAPPPKPMLAGTPEPLGVSRDVPGPIA